MTTKDISKSQGLTRILRSISRNRHFGAIKSTHRHSVWANHFNTTSNEGHGKTNIQNRLLSINTLEIIIPGHSTVIWSGLTFPLPFVVSSTSLKVMVLVSAICPTIYSRSFVSIPSRTWDSFNIFGRASWWASNDSKRDMMEICTGNFFSYSIIEYLLLLTVLDNSTISSSLAFFFFCGSTT